MAIRFRTSIFVAFGLLVLYFVFWRDDAPFQDGSHTIDVLKGVTQENEQDLVYPEPPGDAAPVPTRSVSSNLWQAPSSASSAVVESTSASSSTDAESSTGSAASGTSTGLANGAPEDSNGPAHVESSKGPAVPEATGASADDGSTLQGQFDKEYDALGLKETVGAIYGSTLNHLVGAGSHAGFHAAALTPTESWTPYSNTPPYTYNPYPDYNGKSWNANNVGSYLECDGPEGPVKDVLVFSGHPETFEEPLMGSYVPLDIDSNLCFERETRLGIYGYQDEESSAPMDTNTVEKRTDWDSVNWRLLQERCVEKNANRFSPVKGNLGSYSQDISNSSTTSNGTEKDSSTSTVEDDVEPREEGLHGMPEVKITVNPRTAVLLRSSSSKNYTENDIQNIRSLITELALRSGGEYTVYLMVQVEDNTSPIWNDAHEEADRVGVPQEFRNMSIFWNEAMMKEFYFKSTNDNTALVSEWLPVQKFAADYPQYDFYWNWELDSRYTGHHYNLFEKLVAFAKAQPRKGLWERNERFYIPSVHGPYDSEFRATVEQVSGLDTVWGAPKVEGVKPVGPVRSSQDPRDDSFEWGVGEDADYISLAPIFNPVNTTWPNQNEIWGYASPDDTPRRATVGMNSRCSKKLLRTMDAENLRGNYIGSEMGPQTVALLHGLKAVFAPIPTFFDRAWNGTSLEKYLNPGPKGVSGSCPNSPFGEGKEVRFEGSTWYEKAVVPRRLYNPWMGWEYRGTGGAEWEKAHGRTCLPPILLHPIKNVVKPLPDHSSKP